MNCHYCHAPTEQIHTARTGFIPCGRCGHDVTNGLTREEYNAQRELPERDEWHELTNEAESTTGQKHDQGKARWDLLPYQATASVVDVLTIGAGKYGDNNWQQVPNSKARYFAAAMRHLVAYITGNELDPETQKPHLAHAICCLLFLLEPITAKAATGQQLEDIHGPLTTMGTQATNE